METLALIPARSGSKGIPHKNVRPFRGKPLLAHSIEQARSTRGINRVVVSTDDEEYARIAREYGAETPFIRPTEISGDLATDLEVFQHALGWLANHEGYCPEVCVHLRPTFPTRRVADIEAAMALLVAPPHCDSIRSVVPAAVTPFKMWFVRESGFMEPVVVSESVPEAYNRPRQDLPPTWAQNACIDVVWTRVILQQGSMTGRLIRPFMMNDFRDIDEFDEFESAERMVESTLPHGKTLVVDIDGVLATLTAENDYANAGPVPENIDAVNRLYEAGNRIVIFTARGSVTGVDWYEVTARQLSRWGVRYHELRFGKPAADVYVDDRFASPAQMRRMARN